MSKRLLSILLVFLFAISTLSGCSLTREPLHPQVLKPGEIPLQVSKSSMIMFGVAYPEIHIVALTNRITIKDIKVNRGRVQLLANSGLDKIIEVIKGRFPVELQYGDEYKSYVEANASVREVLIDTNYGSFTFTFSQ